MRGRAYKTLKPGEKCFILLGGSGRRPEILCGVVVRALKETQETRVKALVTERSLLYPYFFNLEPTESYEVFGASKESERLIALLRQYLPNDPTAAAANQPFCIVPRKEGN